MCQVRRSSCFVLVFSLLVGSSDLAHAVFRTWDPVNFSVDWHTAANWDPDGVPGTNDEVQISNAGIQPLLTADSAPVNRVLITAGTLRTNEHTLNVDNGGNGLLDIDGIGGTATVLVIPKLGGGDALVADEIDLGSDGTLRLDGANVSAQIDGQMTIDSGGELRTTGPGNKTLSFGETAVDALVNDGAINATSGTTTLSAGVPNVDFDLDGSLSLGENGQINVSSGATLVVDGGVADNFSGVMNIGSGGALASLDIQDDDGIWLSDGQINLNNGDLTGSQFLNTGGISGHGTIMSASLQNSSESTLTVDGGTLVLHTSLNSFLRGLVVLNQDLRLIGHWDVLNDTFFSGDGVLNVDSGEDGILIIQDGTEIAVDVLNEGRIAIALGMGIGQVDFGKYTQTEFGALEITLDGIVPGEFDAVTVEENILLDGTLAVALTPNFDAVVGNTLTILSSTSGLVSGEFEFEDMPVFDGLTFDVGYNASSVVLEVVEAGIPGDFDFDDDVDGDDFLLWQRGGSPDPLSQSDLDDWEANYGTVAPLEAAASAVPEPGGLLLMLAAISCVSARRHARFRRYWVSRRTGGRL